MKSKHWTVEQNDAGQWEIGYWENGCFNIDDSTPYWTNAEAKKVLAEMLKQEAVLAANQRRYEAQCAYVGGYAD